MIGPGSDKKCLQEVELEHAVPISRVRIVQMSQSKRKNGSQEEELGQAASREPRFPQRSSLSRSWHTWSRKTTLVFVKFVCWMLMSLSIFLNKMYPAARNSMPAKAACSPSKCLISRLLNIKLSSHKWPKAQKMMIMDTYPKVCRAPTHGRGSILLLCLLPPSSTKLKFSEIEKKCLNFLHPTRKFHNFESVSLDWAMYLSLFVTHGSCLRKVWKNILILDIQVFTNHCVRSALGCSSKNKVSFCDLAT